MKRRHWALFMVTAILTAGIAQAVAPTAGAFNDPRPCARVGNCHNPCGTFTGNPNNCDRLP